MCVCVCVCGCVGVWVCGEGTEGASLCGGLLREAAEFVLTVCCSFWGYFYCKSYI